MRPIVHPDALALNVFARAQFESLHRLWKDEGISNLDTVTGTGWPRQFNADVALTLQALRKRYEYNLQQTGRI